MVFWLALAASLALAAAGIAFAVVRGLGLWRTAKRSGGALTEKIEEVAQKAEGIEEHLARAEEASARLREATGRLGQSRARLDLSSARSAKRRPLRGGGAAHRLLRRCARRRGRSRDDTTRCSSLTSRTSRRRGRPREAITRLARVLTRRRLPTAIASRPHVLVAYPPRGVARLRAVLLSPPAPCAMPSRGGLLGESSG